MELQLLKVFSSKNANFIEVRTRQLNTGRDAELMNTPRMKRNPSVGFLVCRKPLIFFRSKILTKKKKSFITPEKKEKNDEGCIFFNLLNFYLQEAYIIEEKVNV